MSTHRWDLALSSLHLVSRVHNLVLRVLNRLYPIYVLRAHYYIRLYHMVGKTLSKILKAFERFFWNWPQQATGIWVYFSILVCCIQTCTKSSEHIGTNSRIRYIKFRVNTKEYEHFCKFEIKYCGKTVLTDPFNYIVVAARDLMRSKCEFSGTRVPTGTRCSSVLLNTKFSSVEG